MAAARIQFLRDITSRHSDSNRLQVENLQGTPGCREGERGKGEEWAGRSGTPSLARLSGGSPHNAGCQSQSHDSKRNQNGIIWFFVGKPFLHHLGSGDTKARREKGGGQRGEVRGMAAREVFMAREEDAPRDEHARPRAFPYLVFHPSSPDQALQPTPRRPSLQRQSLPAPATYPPSLVVRASALKSYRTRPTSIHSILISSLAC